MVLRCRDNMLHWPKPVVMGIANITPDSFYDGGRHNLTTVIQHIGKMLSEGAAIIDIGGMSSRPGAEIISADEEWNRIEAVLIESLRTFKDAVFSVDTLHASVAARALEAGAHIINDISAGRYDKDMLAVVGKHKVPFICMHMNGLPASMQQQTNYEHLLTDVLRFFSERILACHENGITDVMLDVGFGFGKTLEQNYELLRNLRVFNELNCILVAGISRKSMIQKVLGNDAAASLNGTTAAHVLALLNGAYVLRVHDVKEAVESVKIVQACYPPITDWSVPVAV